MIINRKLSRNYNEHKSMTNAGWLVWWWAEANLSCILVYCGTRKSKAKEATIAVVVLKMEALSLNTMVKFKPRGLRLQEYRRQRSWPLIFHLRFHRNAGQVARRCLNLTMEYQCPRAALLWLSPGCRRSVEAAMRWGDMKWFEFVSWDTNEVVWQKIQTMKA